MTGFLLGPANGTSCLVFCAPVLAPYLVAEGQGAWRTVPLLGRFMLGRLIGYLVFGVLAGIAGSFIATGIAHALIFGAGYLGLAALLLLYGLGPSARPAPTCAVGGRTSLARRLAARWPALLPVLLGLFTGFNLSSAYERRACCPAHHREKAWADEGQGDPPQRMAPSQRSAPVARVPLAPSD